jgi:hypothetical protein
MSAPKTAPILFEAALPQGTGREGNQQKSYGARALVAGGVRGGETYRRTGDPFQATAMAAAMAAGMHPAFPAPTDWQKRVLAGAGAAHWPGGSSADCPSLWSWPQHSTRRGWHK